MEDVYLRLKNEMQSAVASPTRDAQAKHNFDEHCGTSSYIVSRPYGDGAIELRCHLCGANALL